MLDHSDVNQQILADFEKDVLKRFPEEAVGAIVDGQYIPIPNTADDPCRDFKIDPLHYVKTASIGKIQAILHSHPYDKKLYSKWPPEWPSTTDMRSWIDGDIPWGIVSTDGEGISKMIWMDDSKIEPFEGREFIHGINDCYSLVRDYFRVERKIVLPNFPRGMGWWNLDKNLYDDNFAKAGFSVISTDEIQPGDCLMMRYASRVTNHAAVVIGSDKMLHHIPGHLSGYDTIAQWSKHIVRAVRYKGSET